MTTVTAKKVLLKDEFGNPIVPYTIPTNYIGQLIPINCSDNYTPSSTLCCNGTEYMGVQFPHLWENYLRGEGDFTLSVIDKFCAVDYKGVYTLSDYLITPVLSSRDTIGYCPCYDNNNEELLKEVVLCLSYSEVTTCQSIISSHNGVHALYIENGNLCLHSSKNSDNNSWNVTILKTIVPNTPFYIKAESYTYTGDKYSYRWLCNYYYSSNGKGWELLTTDETLMKKNSINCPLQSWFSDEVRFGETNTITATIDGYNSYVIDSYGEKHSVVQQNNYTQNKLQTCSYLEYDREVEQTGECYKFGVDLELELFRTPLIRDTETVVTNNLDYDNGVEITTCPLKATPFVAPCDGVLVLTLWKNSNATSYCYINGVQRTLYHDGDNTNCPETFYIPLRKGDEVYWSSARDLHNSYFYLYEEKINQKPRTFVVVSNT